VSESDLPDTFMYALESGLPKTLLSATFSADHEQDDTGYPIRNARAGERTTHVPFLDGIVSLWCRGPRAHSACLPDQCLFPVPVLSTNPCRKCPKCLFSVSRSLLSDLVVEPSSTAVSNACDPVATRKRWGFQEKAFPSFNCLVKTKL
jgi:hypothetical protein